MSKHCNKPAVLFAMAALTLIFTHTDAVEGSSSCKVDLVHEEISASIENERLDSVLAIIGEKTGISFEFPNAHADSVISTRFQSLSIEKALDRILCQYNFVKIYGRSAHIQDVIIINFKSNTGEQLNDRQASTSRPIQAVLADQNKKITNFSDSSPGACAYYTRWGRIKSLDDPEALKGAPPNNGKMPIVTESVANRASGFSDGTAGTPAGNAATEVNLELGRLAAGQPTESSPDITKPTKGMLSQPVGKEELKTSNPDIPMVIERPTGGEMKIGAPAERMTIDP